MTLTGFNQRKNLMVLITNTNEIIPFTSRRHRGRSSWAEQVLEGGKKGKYQAGTLRSFDI